MGVLQLIVLLGCAFVVTAEPPTGYDYPKPQRKNTPSFDVILSSGGSSQGYPSGPSTGSYQTAQIPSVEYSSSSQSQYTNQGFTSYDPPVAPQYVQPTVNHQTQQIPSVQYTKQPQFTKPITSSYGPPVAPQYTKPSVQYTKPSVPHFNKPASSYGPPVAPQYNKPAIVYQPPVRHSCKQSVQHQPRLNPQPKQEYIYEPVVQYEPQYYDMSHSSDSFVSQPVQQQVSQQEHYQVTQRVSQPVQQQIHHHVQQQVYQPVQEQIYQPVQEQIYQPVQEQIYQPVQEQIYQPVQEQFYRVSQPVQQQISQPVTSYGVPVSTSEYSSSSLSQQLPSMSSTQNFVGTSDPVIMQIASQIPGIDVSNTEIFVIDLEKNKGSSRQKEQNNYESPSTNYISQGPIYKPSKEYGVPF